MMDINEIRTFDDSEKDNNQLNMLNAWLNKSHNQLKQFPGAVIEGKFWMFYTLSDSFVIF